MYFENGIPEGIEKDELENTLVHNVLTTMGAGGGVILTLAFIIYNVYRVSGFAKNVLLTKDTKSGGKKYPFPKKIIIIGVVIGISLIIIGTIFGLIMNVSTEIVTGGELANMTKQEQNNHMIASLLPGLGALTIVGTTIFPVLIYLYRNGYRTF